MAPFVLVAFIVLAQATAVYKVSNPGEDNPVLFKTQEDCEAKLQIEKPTWGEVIDADYPNIVFNERVGPVELSCKEYEGDLKEAFPTHVRPGA